MTVGILNQYGRPFATEAKVEPRRDVNASYDLSKTTAHNRKHWAAADSLAARAAMSPAIRAIVRKRSRYEFDNNSVVACLVSVSDTFAFRWTNSGPQTCTQEEISNDQYQPTKIGETLVEQHVLEEIQRNARYCKRVAQQCAREADQSAGRALWVQRVLGLIRPADCRNN